MNGFVLSGWQCISVFRFVFFVSLDTTLPVFYDNYYQFLLDLVDPLETTNVEPVSINSIVPSSVNINGTISTVQQSGSNQVGNEYYGIENVLSGSSVAGMPVISYTLTSQGGDIPDQGSGVNVLAIVLGICIPVGIISNFLS